MVRQPRPDMHATTDHLVTGRPVTFLYADAALVVVDKPAGQTVVPSAHASEQPCLQAQVAAAVGQRVWVVHRLDRETSGAVAFALSAEAHRALSMAFEARTVQKIYLALVAGRPEPPDGQIDVPLHDARRGKSRPAQPGERGARAATTRYHVDAVWGTAGEAIALVRAHPETGRHHQVRVHLRAIGHPILGDALYGRGARAGLSSVPVPRLALHAARLDLPHPVSGRRVVVDAPLPDDLRAVTAWIDAQSTRDAAS